MADSQHCHDEALAQYGLGLVFANGWGVEQDDAAAVQWFTKAATAKPCQSDQSDGGLARAQFSLAVMYHHGRGCQQDIKKALHWYSAAAAQKHPKALYSLGTSISFDGHRNQRTTVAP
jgi:uncharacterized protein